MRASIWRPPAAGSICAQKPVMMPARRSRLTRSAAALALRPTRAPRSRQDRRASSRRRLRIAPSVASIAAIIAAFAGRSLRVRNMGWFIQRMSLIEAVGAGLIVGIAIATQFGAVSALLLETAVLAGPRTGAAAGLGVASVDMAYAGAAVLVGGAARAGLAAHQGVLRAAAAVIVALVGARGLWAALRAPSFSPAAATTGDPTGTVGTSSTQYLRFVGLTAINPLTVVYFGSVTASLTLRGVPESVAFVAGAGIASALWHLLLALAAGHAGRRFSPKVQRAVSIAGRVTVLVIAARIALGI